MRGLLSAMVLILAVGLGGAEESISEAEGQKAAAADRPDTTTFVIPVDGVIEQSLLYIVRRGVKEAEGSGAGAIVLVMDTWGGRLDATEQIVRLLLGVKIPTYTYVKGKAISAGAIIAMATDEIYMAPGSVIGDAMPVMVTPFGGAQEMSEALEEKGVSGVAALIRTAAQQKGHSPDVAEAMVRRGMKLEIGGKVISEEGHLLTLTNVEAGEPAGEEGKALLSAGTVESLDAMLQKTGLSDGKLVEMRVTGVEKTARFIERLSPLLLAAGLLGLYLEFKTPGFGLIGITGIACLMVFFWGHHIAGLAGMEELLLFMLGCALLFVEIFFIPGFGFVGVTGIALIAVSVISAMVPQVRGISWQEFVRDVMKAFEGFGLAAILALAGALVLGRFLPRSSPFKRLMLFAEEKHKAGFSAAARAGVEVGAVGQALSALRPSGIGVFGESRFDVVADGEFIEQGLAIRVTGVSGSRITVEPAGQQS